MLFYTPSKNPFVQENRQMGIYFGYPTQEKLLVNLEIPEGYVIETLPKSVRLALEDNSISLSLKVWNEGNKIQFSFSKDINNSIFAAENYNALKTVFQKMIASQNEKIVLKKA